MDEAQTFIKENLLTKCFTDPEKPIKEGRLDRTLLLLPTDGGLATRLHRAKSKTKLSIENLHNATRAGSIRQTNYREINKNSKLALRNYINECRRAVHQAKRISYEHKLKTKQELLSYLETEKPDVFDRLPKYDKFLPMYSEFWLNYIKELLGIPERGVEDVNSLTSVGSQATLRLSMADFNGALLGVTKSRNHNMVGIKGIVIWDSQKNFIMVTKGDLVDEIKCIPKKRTVFNFEVPINERDALLYTILGDRFKYRSYDRSGRKFKSRRCDPLLFYVYPGDKS